MNQYKSLIESQKNQFNLIFRVAETAAVGRNAEEISRTFKTELYKFRVLTEDKKRFIQIYPEVLKSEYTFSEQFFLGMEDRDRRNIKSMFNGLKFETETPVKKTAARRVPAPAHVPEPIKSKLETRLNSCITFEAWKEVNREIEYSHSLTASEKTELIRKSTTKNYQIFLTLIAA